MGCTTKYVPEYIAPRSPYTNEILNFTSGPNTVSSPHPDSKSKRNITPIPTQVITLDL